MKLKSQTNRYISICFCSDPIRKHISLWYLCSLRLRLRSSHGTYGTYCQLNFRCLGWTGLACFLYVGGVGGVARVGWQLWPLWSLGKRQGLLRASLVTMSHKEPLSWLQLGLPLRLRRRQRKRQPQGFRRRGSSSSLSLKTFSLTCVARDEPQPSTGSEQSRVEQTKRGTRMTMRTRTSRTRTKTRDHVSAKSTGCIYSAAHTCV